MTEVTEPIYDVHMLMHDWHPAPYLASQVPGSRDLLHKLLAHNLSITPLPDLIPRDNPDYIDPPWEDVAFFCSVWWAPRGACRCYWPLDLAEDADQLGVYFQAGFSHDRTAIRAILIHRELTLQVGLDRLDHHCIATYGHLHPDGWTGWMRWAHQSRADH